MALGAGLGHSLRDRFSPVPGAQSSPGRSWESPAGIASARLTWLLRATPSWCRLPAHEARRAASRAACTAGSRSATRMPMMATTTSSSIAVKPAGAVCRRILFPSPQATAPPRNGGQPNFVPVVCGWCYDRRDLFFIARKSSPSVPHRAERQPPVPATGPARP
jgi:hypothetical protein